MKKLIVTLLLFSVGFTEGALAAGKLYPGEQLIEVNQTQSLIKFTKADAQKPLVVFVPGDSHLARIAYGYPAGQAKDFLAYWLQQKGYSFLGVSYPLDNPVYSKVYPGFSIQDWGNLIAAAAEKVIQENKLGRHVVVLGWSMGGSVEETVNVALKKRGLTLDLFIGLSAVPPLPYVMQAGPYDTNKILPNKLADRSILTPIFVKMVEEQSQYHQHDIIPKDIYQDEFLGNFPTALSAEGYHYQNGKFIYNINQTLADGGVFNFADTPWIALIRDDSPSTAKLSLIDPAIWNYLRAEMVYKNYLANQALSSLPRDKWEAISKMIDTLPQQLTMTVHGNHFFFVGEKGARETAEDVDELISRVKKISLSFHR